MTRKVVKQKVRIYHWGGFSNGVELPELTLGYIVIQRTFIDYREGYMKLNPKEPERLLTVNEEPINCLWSEAILQEFFPEFTGYEVLGEV
jgi:hypothetical protein